jgi:hypothetical protein
MSVGDFVIDNRCRLMLLLRFRSWLRHYAKRQKVAGSIPNEVMALGSTQPLTEMSTRNLPGGKGRPARWADDFTAIYETIV